jgi:hypothetical protein
MVKTKLKIIKHEAKTSKGGKDYTRFQTSNGWMSAFDDDTIEDLKAAEGRIVSVEVAESEKDGRSFSNIRKFYGIIAGKEELDQAIKETDDFLEEVEKVLPKNFAKPTAEKVIAEAKKSVYTPTSMYVSYAKDIFNEIIQHPLNKEMTNLSQVMDIAINLVKQAHKAFE